MIVDSPVLDPGDPPDGAENPLHHPFCDGKMVWQLTVHSTFFSLGKSTKRYNLSENFPLSRVATWLSDTIILRFCLIQSCPEAGMVEDGKHKKTIQWYTTNFEAPRYVPYYS